jgi:hypothetical protein
VDKIKSPLEVGLLTTVYYNSRYISLHLHARKGKLCYILHRKDDMRTIKKVCNFIRLYCKKGKNAAMKGGNYYEADAI